MRFGELVLAVAALVGSAAASGPAAGSQQRSPGVQRVVYVLEVDPALARKAGWAREEASEARIVQIAAGIVQRRVGAMERSFQIQVKPEDLRIELSMPQIQPRDRELFEQVLASLGQCEFLWVVDDELARQTGIDLELERKRLEAWRAANPGTPLEVFHELDSMHAGPHRRVLWVEAQFANENGASVQGPPLALLLPDKPEDHFGSGCFARIEPAQDMYGHPALAFELVDSRKEDFARITGANLERRLGIVLEGNLRSAPTLHSALHGKGILEGRFRAEECERLASALSKRYGPLRVEIR
jgi:preprotein translocase subunit SecD